MDPFPAIPPAFRQRLLQLHLLAGLAAGLVLVVMAAAGAWMVFRPGRRHSPVRPSWPRVRILSQEGQEAIIVNGNYLPLPAGVTWQQRTKLE